MRLLRRVREALEELGLFEKRSARERSCELLLRCLSPAQRAEFERSSSFTVRGQSGQRYRITYLSFANVEVLGPSDKVDWRLCAGPVGLSIPAMMLAQKLMLETQEAEFIRIAARTPGAENSLVYAPGAGTRL